MLCFSRMSSLLNPSPPEMPQLLPRGAPLLLGFEALIYYKGFLLCVPTSHDHFVLVPCKPTCCDCAGFCSSYTLKPTCLVLRAQALPKCRQGSCQAPTPWQCSGQSRPDRTLYALPLTISPTNQGDKTRI